MTEGFELELLKSLLEVMETESITVAAKRLGLTQSTVSKHITSLEARFATRLFYRDGRGVKATPSGYLLAERSKRILDRLSSIGPHYASVADPPSVRIMMPPSVGALSFASFYSILLDHTPDAVLRITDGAAGDVTEALRHGEIDIAVLYSLPDLRGLTPINTIVYPLHLVVPVRGPLSLGRSDASIIGEMDFALPARPDGLRLQVEEHATTFGHKFNVKFEIGSIAMIKDLIRNGLAASYLPWSVIAEDVNAGKMQIIPAAQLSPSLSIIVPTGRLRSNLIRRVSEDLAVVLERQIGLSVNDFQASGSNVGQPLALADKLPGGFDT